MKIHGLPVRAYFMAGAGKSVADRFRYALWLWRVSGPAASARRQATMELIAKMHLQGKPTNMIRRVDGNVIELRSPDKAA